ncbi:GlsB/YeaQ/YmgE family stress response membrane protein [Marinobacter daepoensis]|nr:GlsB/YeaQ/YmgE family stress response membrane protein [Marinobacter daepoensis]
MELLEQPLKTGQSFAQSRPSIQTHWESEAMNLIWFLIIGGLAGWLAGLIMKGKGFGVLANIGIGIVGSFIGGFLFGVLQLSAHGAVGRLVTATVGAVLLLAIVNKIKKG